MSKGGKKVTPVFKNGEANGFSFTGAGNGGDRVTLVDDTGQEITISGGSSGTETDPIWTADKPNYYTKLETNENINTAVTNVSAQSIYDNNYEFRVDGDDAVSALIASHNYYSGDTNFINSLNVSPENTTLFSLKSTEDPDTFEILESSSSRVRLTENFLKLTREGFSQPNLVDRADDEVINKGEIESLISNFLIPETATNTLTAVDLTAGPTVFTHTVQTAGVFNLTGVLNSTTANVSITFNLLKNAVSIASVVYDSGVQNTSQVYGSNLHEFSVGDVITVTATSPTTVTGHVKMIKVDKPTVVRKKHTSK